MGDCAGSPTGRLILNMVTPAVARARWVRAVCPDVAILVVVGREDLAERRALHELRVPRYVSRMALQEEFRGAVAAVARGGRVVVTRGGPPRRV